MQTLITQALSLPATVERLIHQVADTKQAMHDLLQERSKLEATIAGDVANEPNGDGRKKYPNEEARKAEIAQRLAGNVRYQELDANVRQTRDALVDLEGKLDRSRYEHRTATALINLMTAAIQNGRQDVEALIAGKPQPVTQPQPVEQQPEAQQSVAPITTTVTADEQKAYARKQFTQELQGIAENEDYTVPKANINGNGHHKEAKVIVLEARPGKSAGTVRAYCQTEEGEKVAVFAKNGSGKKLAASLSEAVIIKYKEMDHGWFAVAVS